MCKGSLSMAEYLKKVSIVKDAIVVAGERLKESQIILITLDGLGIGYKSFVTSITTQFDHNMTFAMLQHLLMDYDLAVSAAKEAS